MIVAVEELQSIEKQFIDENQKFSSKKTRTGGPYNKKDRVMRRDQVYKMHFELGYSAVKISEMLKTNRNTINSDINYWYSKLADKWNRIDFETTWAKQLDRFETQRTRLLEQLDKQENFSSKLALEKMIFEIDSRIEYIITKAMSAKQNVLECAKGVFNSYAKMKKLDISYFTYNDIFKVQGKTGEKIRKLFRDDETKWIKEK